MCSLVWRGEEVIRGIQRVRRDRKRLERAHELSHHDLVALKQCILADSQEGDLVPGTGGLRKIRLASDRSPGASEAAPVYYLDLPRRAVTHLLAISGK